MKLLALKKNNYNTATIKKLVCVFTMLIVAITSSLPVQAFDDFYSDSEIQTYDPNACNPNNSTQPATDDTGQMTGDTDVEKVYKKLIDLGLKPKAAAGIVGNTVYESGGAKPTAEDLNPRSSNGTHIGIVQWDTSDRWPKLVDFAKKKKASKYSLLLQTEFIMEELNDRYKSVKTEMEAASSPKEAALITNQKYEVTGVQIGRQQAAENIYKKYGEGGGSPTSTSDEGAQNCVCQDPSSTGSTSNSDPKTLNEFIKAYADPALAAAKSQGIPYDAMLAQIAHESGLPLSELASKYNNFGGIKYTGKGKSTPPMRTYEEGQGYIMARFRAFDSPQEGLVQQAKFFTENSRYKNALKYPRNPQRFIREVAKAGYATDSQYANKVIAKLKEVQALLVKLGKPLSKNVKPDVVNGSDESDLPENGDCSSGGGSGEVVDGFSFPVGNLTQPEVGTNNPLPCKNSSGCHHDGTAAFDIGKGTRGVLNGRSKGLPVFAIEDGEIVQYNPAYTFGGNSFPGCPTYQLKGESGWVYWYGHTAKTKLRQGSKVSAGERIAEIGSSRCTGNGSMPHLHIDRGKPKGHFGGSVGSRDSSFIGVINKLWEALPDR